MDFAHSRRELPGVYYDAWLPMVPRTVWLLHEKTAAPVTVFIFTGSRSVEVWHVGPGCLLWAVAAVTVYFSGLTWCSFHLLGLFNASGTPTGSC